MIDIATIDGGVEPLLALAPVQHELQAAEAQRPSARGPTSRSARACAGYGESNRNALARTKPSDADRQVDVEDPAPRPLVGEVAADRGPEDRAEDEADAPHRHGEPALVEGEDLPQDRLRQRDDRARRRGPGRCARRSAWSRSGAAPEMNELTVNSVRQIRKKRLRPNTRGEPSGGRDDDGVGGEVRGDHPRDLVEPGRERALQVRQHDVGHAGVEDLHEGDHHDREGDGPLAAGGDRGRFGGGRCHARRAGCLAAPRGWAAKPGNGQITVTGVIASSCRAGRVASRPRPRALGQFASPCFVASGPQPSTYTHVRLGLPGRSRLAWLATCPSAGGQSDTHDLDGVRRGRHGLQCTGAAVGFARARAGKERSWPRRRLTSSTSGPTWPAILPAPGASSAP